MGGCADDVLRSRGDLIKSILVLSGSAHLGVAEDGGDIEASGTFHVHEEAEKEQSLSRAMSQELGDQTVDKNNVPGTAYNSSENPPQYEA